MQTTTGVITDPAGLRDFHSNRQTFDSAGINGLAMMGNNAGRFMNDAAVSSGMAFLTSELARRDPKIREPLTSVIWPRDIEAILGGGWIDFTEVDFVDYGISGPNTLGLTGNDTTQIPVVSANLLKDIYRVFNFQNVMQVSYIDTQKSNTIGRSLDKMLDTGIKLNYQKAVEQVVYQGWQGYPGLLNSTAIASGFAAVGSAGGTAWVTKTPDEILADINNVMVSTVTASNYDLSGMATHILIPWSQYAYLASGKVSSAGNVSVLKYLLENNIAKNQGLDLQIHPCRWCSGMGSGGSDRMAAYVNDKDKVQFDLPVPLSRIMTVPSVINGGAYQTIYAAQIGVVKFLYNQTAQYVDGL